MVVLCSGYVWMWNSTWWSCVVAMCGCFCVPTAGTCWCAQEGDLCHLQDQEQPLRIRVGLPAAAARIERLLRVA